MEKRLLYHSYKIITERKHYHKLTTQEFLNNSCKCPLIFCKKVMKYKLQEFYSLMSNNFYDWKLDTYRPKPFFHLRVESFSLGTDHMRCSTKTLMSREVKTNPPFKLWLNYPHKWGLNLHENNPTSLFTFHYIIITPKTSNYIMITRI